jgi:sugar lactone lactonase YvrE
MKSGRAYGKREETTMRQDCRQLAFALVLTALLPLTALAWDRGEVERFATLPAGDNNPEGITADRHGNIYVTTFDPTGASPGRLVVFDRHGELVRDVVVDPASGALLGLAFHPKTGALLIVDIGAGVVRKVNPHNGHSSVFMTLPAGTTGAGLNALTFDRDGDVYVSDSFLGIIWKTGRHGGEATAWVKDALLTTSGFPPFGANGLAFNRHGHALFVANTGNDQVIRIPVRHDGTAGTPEVFVNSVNGADGLIIDRHDNLWICANQADEIVVLDKTGRVIAKLGDFDGISRRGAPRGLLFPASLVRVGDWIYVTNLSLDLTKIGLPQAVDSQWAAEVTRQTVSRLKAKIPPVRGRDDRRDD